MSDFTGLYDIRLGTSADRNFILSTYLRGLYYGNSYFNKVLKDIFMKNYKVIAERLISGNKTKVKVACLREDPDVILGYSILSLDETVLHWVFVKSAWRNKGIAKSLVPNVVSSVSQVSDLGLDILNNLEKDVIFNPFTL